jgi:hypothetical protein
LQDVGPVMYRMVDVRDLLDMRQAMPTMVSAGNNLPLSRCSNFRRTCSPIC